MEKREIIDNNIRRFHLKSSNHTSYEMSTTMISDAMVMPVTESTNPITEITEIEFAKCDCCGLTEECTRGYIERITERYQGKWICGLCGEAVKDEIIRSERLITTDEAMTRHMTFCRSPNSSGLETDPTVGLISAMRQILRRSLDSSSSARSMPCSPTTKNDNDVRITRSESCISNLGLVVGSSSYSDLEEDGERLNEMEYVQTQR